jgi:integrase
MDQDSTMGRQIERLTPGKVQKATKPGMYPDGAGLYLRIGPNGAKSWVFRYTDGKTASGQQRHRDMGLGPLHTIGLAEARERARQQRLLRLDGGDPIATRWHERERTRAEAAKTMTFEECGKAYIAGHSAAWKNSKHAAQWPSTMGTYVYPMFGSLPVQAIDVGLVMKVLEPIWSAKPETASRVRGRIESVLDWATVRGYRQGDNPARWKGHLDHLLPAPTKAKQAVRQVNGRDEHHAALAYRELPEFMAGLRDRSGLAARCMEFVILTAARTGEAIGTRWSEIELESRLWTIPGTRMKGGREHRVPLSDAALAVLRSLYDARKGDKVFPVSNMAMLMLLRRMGRGELTVHGFRSTFSDWCAEQTNTPSEVREMALAHAVGDKVEAAYRRGDLFAKRRELAEAWGRYCSGDGHEGEKVIRLRTA